MVNLCRTCLRKDVDLEPLFSKDIIEIIKILSSIEVKPTDKLSKKICQKCIIKLNDYYAFRENIIESDKFLRKQNQNHMNVNKESEILDCIEIHSSNFSEQFENRNTTSDLENDCDSIMVNQISTRKLPKSNLDVDDDKDISKSAEVGSSISSMNLENEDFIDEIKIEYETNEVSNLDNVGEEKEEKIHCILKDEVTETFRCSACDFETQEADEMQEHYILNNSIENCKVCDKAVKKLDIRNHMKLHCRKRRYQNAVGRFEKRFICTCGYKTNVESEIFEHGRTGDHLCLCPYCPKMYARKSFLEHVKTHLTDIEKHEGDLICEFCVFKTSNAQAFNEHRKTHENDSSDKIKFELTLVTSRNNQSIICGETTIDGKTVYVCRKCKHLSQDEADYKAHKKTHVRRAVCHICGRNVTIYKYHTHMMTHSTARINCEICNESVKKSSYNVHKYKHTKEDNTCEICGAHFTIKSSFLYHMKQHRASKEHVCRICEKVFKKRNILQSHMLTHTGERPHSCEVCNKTFGTKSVLRTHMRQHTNETPYACQICSMAFRQNVSLRRHMTSKHKSDSLQDTSSVLKIPDADNS